MVIVRLTGGLGNQMFQYAAAKRLSQTHGVELKLDARRLQGDSYRKFQLGAFNIPEELATEDEIRRIKLGAMFTWLLMPTHLLTGFNFKLPEFYSEKQYAFDPLVMELGNQVYLKGRFHSEKYFSDITDTIAENYTLRSVSEKARKLENDITSVDSVSIHVRRGDYISNSHNLARYGTCDDSYYERSVEKALKHSETSKFFIFSDEPDWVSENMPFPENSVFVTSEGLNGDAEELYLMSLCRQHITANSTFSWWGAWLDRKADKAVYTPGRWFLAEDLDTRDLIPEAWIKV
jgi:hypothetical protein